MDIQSAINAPRFHHQWLPEKIEFENGVFDELSMKKLQDKGYDAKADIAGDWRVDAILVSKSGIITTGADPRGDDSASHGYELIFKSSHARKNNYINIEGARVHNLKNIDLKIPRNKLVVITGLSEVENHPLRLILSTQKDKGAIWKHFQPMSDSF